MYKLLIPFTASELTINCIYQELAVRLVIIIVLGESRGSIMEEWVLLKMRSRVSRGESINLSCKRSYEKAVIFGMVEVVSKSNLYP